MPTTIIFIAVIVIIAFVFLSLGADTEGRRRRALQSLAKLLGAPLESIEGYENCYKVSFKYQNRECSYEDIEEKGFQGQPFRRGLLKVKTATTVTVGFSEGDPGSVRENIGSFSDISNPWAQNVGKLFVPKGFEKFNIFTNNNQLTNILFEDDQALKVFERFKNIDSRGHPVMSLEVFDGVLVLKFHVGGLKPNLNSFYGNVSTIEEYMIRLNVVADKIETVDREIKGRTQ